MRVECYYNGIMNRDNFQLREHGGTMAQAFKLLEGDMAPKNQPSAEAKNSFEFSQGGVGLYIARSPEEEQDWARWIRRWSESDNCNLMEFSVTELMSASNILPPRDGIEEASIDLFDRCGVLSRKNNPNIDIVGVARMMADARVDSEETDVLIVECPDIYVPGKFETIDHFKLACEFGNMSALEIQKRTNQNLKDDIESADVRLKYLSARLRKYIQEKVNTIGDHESIISALRTEGRQTSPELADALEYEYYEHLRRFVDVGSAYRHIPPNVKIALIVGPSMFDKMTGGYMSGYSTVQEVRDLGIGTYDFRSNDPITESMERRKDLQNATWRVDPEYEMRKAALIYAKYQLPRAVCEDIAPSKNDDTDSSENYDV